MTNGEEDADERAEKLAGRFSTPDANEASETQSPNGTSNASNTQEGGEVEEAKEPEETEPGEASNTPLTAMADEAQETPQTADESGDRPVRELETKLLYLDDEFLQELELIFDELNLRYKRKHGDELQKNRDYYPALLQLGLEQLGDVRDQDLEELEEILDI